MRAHFALAALLLANAGAAQAQTAPQATPAPAPVDSARLAAAQQLLTVMVPPAQREQMVEGMIRPMMANIRQSMSQAPGFAELFEKDSGALPVFERFLKKQEDRSVATVRAGMPGMIDAMARAYARNFDVQQLGEIRAFYQTPTGQAFVTRTSAIMSDPDVLAWQRDLMTRSMAHIQEDIGKFVEELSASKTSENQ